MIGGFVKIVKMLLGLLFKARMYYSLPFNEYLIAFPDTSA
jgi:hypothetical protein